jgi:folate-binding protein YgfZ
VNIPGPRPTAPRDYAAALAGLAHRHRPAGVVAVSGADRSSFLQGQLTQDVRGLETGQARRAAGLTPKGKLLYSGWLVAEPERLLLVLPSVSVEGALAHLSRYAVFQKVSVADTTPGYALLGLYGPESAGLALPEGAVRLAAEGEMSSSALAPAALRGAVESSLSRAGSNALSDGSAHILRVEAGRARFGTDADETNLPDEVGFQAAIAPNKGCYVGQEIVARLRTYGNVSRRLVGFRFEGDPMPPGTAFPDPEKPGRELGRVTSSALSPRFGAIGLGLAARDVAEGAALGAAGGASALVAPLPFA